MPGTISLSNQRTKVVHRYTDIDISLLMLRRETLQVLAPDCTEVAELFNKHGCIGSYEVVTIISFHAYL